MPPTTSHASFGCLSSELRACHLYVVSSAAEGFRLQPQRPPVLLLYGEADSVSHPAPSAAGLSAALGAGPMPALLPSPQYLNLPYTVTAAGAANGEGSWGSLPSRKDWVKPQGMTAALVAKAGHNVMLERPVETNQLLWEFVKSHLTD